MESDLVNPSTPADALDLGQRHCSTTCKGCDQDLFDDLDLGVLLLGADDRILVANHAARQLLHIELAQLGTLTTVELLPCFREEDGSPCRIEQFPSTVARHTKAAVRNVTMQVVPLQQGARLWTYVSAKPRFGAEGELSTVLLTVTDITQQRPHADESRRSERMYKVYLDLLPIPAAVISREYRVEYINQRMTEQYGYRLDSIPTIVEWARNTFPDHAYREQVFQEWSTLRKNAKESGGAIGPLTARWRIPDGSYRWVAVTARWLEGRRVVLLDDQTVQQRAKESLRQSETLLNETGELARVGGWELDAESRALRWTRETARLFELPPDFQPTLERAHSFFHSEDGEVFSAALRKALRGGIRFDLELRVITANGRTRWMRVLGRPVTHDEKVVRVAGVFQDITESKLLDTALAESEERYRAIVEQATDGIITTDGEGVILSINRAASVQLGYGHKEVIGQSLLTLFLPELHERLSMLLRQRTDAARRSRTTIEPHEWELIGLHKDGHHVPVSMTLRTVVVAHGRIVLAMLRDLTEEKRHQSDMRQLEAQLYQVQRMEALGLLAGGIAHDFNNLLSTILGFSQLATSWSKGQEKLQLAVQQISVAGQRARELVAQILTFSRRGEEKQEFFNLTAIAKEAERLLRGAMPRNITMSLQCGTEELVVFGFPTQLHQVLLNLCTNAFQAMPNGGQLTLRMDSIDTKQSDSQDQAEVLLPPGRYHRLLISDTGVGMPPEVARRIFEPFFTTKGSRGTGLGLAVAQGIAKKHGGCIAVRSLLGHGSDFVVYLPAASHAVSVRQHRSDAVQLKGEGLVLLIDDEPSVLATVHAMLEELGFVVHSFSSPLAAIATFSEAPHKYTWALTDLRMPMLDGIQVCERLRAVRRDLPIAILSAVSSDAEQRRLEEAKVALVLHKPITPSELSDQLMKVAWLRRVPK